MGRRHFYENPEPAFQNDADPVRNTGDRLKAKTKPYGRVLILSRTGWMVKNHFAY
jgi:hypothetical protein